MTAEELVGINRKEVLRARIEDIALPGLMERDFVSVRPDDSLNDVLGKMRELDLHEVPVSSDGKRLAGIVSYGTLLRRKNLPVSTKVETIMVRPPAIGPGTPLTEAAEALIREGYRQIPVVEGERIAGMLDRGHIISVIQNIPDLRDVPVREVMSPEVRTVKGDDLVVDAVTAMRNLDIRIMPVVDDLGRLMGIVGIKDIVNYNWREKQRQTVGEVVGDKWPANVHVSSVMVEEPVVIGPDASLREAAALLLRRNISTLPVVDDGQLKGIITRYDLVELIASFRRRDMMYMQITGLEQEDRFATDQMERVITQSVQKIARVRPPLMLSLHVGKYGKEGLKTKYSLHGRLVTAEGVLTATSVEWDLIMATTELMGAFERRVIERKEEKLEHRRRARNIGHS